RFHHYSPDSGLAQNSVPAIVQDQRGFVWLGTDDGLKRMAAYEMVVYQARPGIVNGLQSDSVRALRLDANGDLWVGTYGGGITRLDIGEGTFTHFRHVEGDEHTLRSDFVFWLAINPDGTVWARTDKGLDLLDPATGRVTPFPTGEATGLATSEIGSVLVDSQGTAWAATQDGLFVFDPVTRRFSLFRAGDSRYAPFHDEPILALAGTPGDGLLVSTRRGLYRLDAARDPVAYFGPEAFGLPADSDIHLGRLLATSTGEIWASRFGSGIYWLDNESGRFRHYRNDPADRWSLSGDVALSLMEDRTGIVWIGTETGGV